MLNDIKNRNWWRSCSSLEKFLLLVSAFIAATHTTVTADNRSMRIAVDSNLHNTCLSPECKYAASEVLRKMKIGIDPCKDFYQFACGGFINETQIPDDKDEVDTFSTVSDKFPEQLKDIIIEEIPDSEPKHFRLPNALYKACMNETLIESLGVKPMQKLSEALGGWPVVVGNSWDSNNTWTWHETVKRFRYLGFSTDHILKFGVTVDAKNNTRNIIDLDQAYLGLYREHFIRGFNNSVILIYYNLMVDVAILFGAKEKNALTELMESLEFEMELAKISLSHQKRRYSNNLYNLRSIKQMQENYPYVQWLDYVNDLLPENITVDENEIINVRVPNFFEHLGELLNRTDKRTIANYMMWHIHSFSLDFLTDHFIKEEVPTLRAILGNGQLTDRRKMCTDSALSLIFAMGALYVRKYFDRNSRRDAVEIVNNIRGAFNQILNEAAWMDNDTKQRGKNMLQSMAVHIGYHGDFLNNDKLEQFYKKMEIDPEKYFESSLNKNVFKTDYSFSKLRPPVNKTDWRFYDVPYKASATFSTYDGSIDIPAGTWQGQFFNRHRPKYMNYGAIGSIIGHEISHGLIDEDSQFDGNGNLVDSWQPDTRSKFLERLKCIIKQYGNYTDKQTGLNLNGTNTQVENIADNSGVQISYRAYNEWAAKHAQEAKLPDLNYSPQQMFWISYAQTWCAKYTTEYLEDFITIGLHSPSEFRILGSLSNMNEFSRDFQCPECSSMNPVHKCEIW